MDPMTPVEEKNSFLRNDRLLVCSMLVIYGVCILGLVGATVWSLDRRSKTISANATATAFTIATRQAKATATAAAHTTAQAKYAVIDRFDTNKNDWLVGRENNKYWSGDVTIRDGIYRWNVEEVKETFVYWTTFFTNETIHDFDVYVDTRVAEGEPGEVCSAILFRKSPDDLKKGGYYYYALCNDSHVEIYYYSNQDGWENIASIPYHSPLKEWNRMEISARGSHFIFRINGETIYEMDDDRRKTGDIALAIELKKKISASILFDNFGFQSR